MQKKVLLLIIIIFLTSLLGVFVVGNNVRAAKPCSPNECPPSTDKDKKIRLQVYIPGITDTCTYKLTDSKGKVIIEDGKEVTKDCHHIKSNLPAYIKELYSFLIGVIAIIAVISIMIGGLKWILAAGNATVIGAARQQITAAVAGLILALCSFVILNMINPSLTNLKMGMPKDVDTIEQATLWCRNMPAKDDRTGLSRWFQEADGSSRVNQSIMTECGKEYEFGYKDNEGNFVSTSKGQTCFGGKCPSGKACYGESGYSFCVDPKKFCKNYDINRCEELNEMFRISSQEPEILNKSCSKRVDTFLIPWAAPDECVWNDVMVCEKGWERTSCFSGPKKECWEIKKGKAVPTEKGGTTKYYCSDSLYSNLGANYICCKLENGEEYKLSTVMHNSAKRLICDSNQMHCTSYNEKDSCINDLCQTNKDCKWENGSCLEKGIDYTQGSAGRGF